MTMDVDAAGEQHAGCEGPAQPVPGTAAAAHSTSVLCLCMGTHAALRCVLYVAVPHKGTCYGMVSWIPMKKTMT